MKHPCAIGLLGASALLLACGGAGPSEPEPASPSDTPGDTLLIAPPRTDRTWPLDVPSGGVISAAAHGYEYDRGEPDQLVRRSTAVVTATILAIEGPQRIAIDGELPDDETADLAFRHDVVVPISIRIDDVLAGISLEEDGEFRLEVSGWIRDGTFYEFDEDRLPLIGETYLLFAAINRLQDAPAPGGLVRVTAAGAGRIPISEAEAAGLLDPDRWQSALAADFDPDFADEMRAAGLLP